MPAAYVALASTQHAEATTPYKSTNKAPLLSNATQPNRKPYARARSKHHSMPLTNTQPAHPHNVPYLKPSFWTLHLEPVSRCSQTKNNRTQQRPCSSMPMTTHPWSLQDTATSPFMPAHSPHQLESYPYTWLKSSGSWLVPVLFSATHVHGSSNKHVNNHRALRKVRKLISFSYLVQHKSRVK